MKGKGFLHVTFSNLGHPCQGLQTMKGFASLVTKFPAFPHLTEVSQHGHEYPPAETNYKMIMILVMINDSYPNFKMSMRPCCLDLSFETVGGVHCVHGPQRAVTEAVLKQVSSLKILGPISWLDLLPQFNHEASI